MEREESRKKYESPFMEIVSFKGDVICTSGNENETPPDEFFGIFEEPPIVR